MFQTWIDKLFGPSVQGAKTEITAVTMATLNVVNMWLCSFGVICLPDAVLNNINYVLGAALTIFVGSRLNRVVAAATVAATAPAVILTAPVPPSNVTPIQGGAAT